MGFSPHLSGVSDMEVQHHLLHWDTRLNHLTLLSLTLAQTCRRLSAHYSDFFFYTNNSDNCFFWELHSSYIQEHHKENALQAKQLSPKALQKNQLGGTPSSASKSQEPILAAKTPKVGIIEVMGGTFIIEEGATADLDKYFKQLNLN